MSPPAGSLNAATIEGWLAELGIEPTARIDRDAVVAWDLSLDGRRRFDVRFTVILDPAMGLITWVHFAPPIGDGLRKSYHRLLRWNDEFPFVKFALAEDGRPILSTEIPLRILDRDEFGVALARSLAISDALLEESAGWLWIGGRIPDLSGRIGRNPQLFERYAARLPELLGS
ncbi:MAG: YbjN domain-containing protein [Candidatus Limnocylindrales bacterium]